MASGDGKHLAIGAAALLGVGAVALLLESLLQSNPLGAMVIGAVAVDLVAGRLGLRWDETRRASVSSMVLSTLRGFALGSGLALGIVALCTLLGRASLGKGSPSLAGLGLALASALAAAARDELLFRGMPLTIMKGRIPDRYAIGYAALLGAMPAITRTSPGHWTQAVLVLGMGVFHAVLWRMGRGAYLAWGAHAGWLFMAGPATHGVLLDTWYRDGLLVPLAAARGWPAWIAAGGYAIAAGWAAWQYARRLTPAEPPTEG